MKDPNQDPNKLTQYTGLLDFYSDRATAHASFVVASVFGIFTIFAILRAEKSLLWLMWTSTYVALQFALVYCFYKFSYYAVLADIVRRQLEGGKDEISQPLITALKCESKKTRFRLKYRIIEKFESGTKDSHDRKRNLFLFVWFFGTVVPFLVLLLERIISLVFVAR